MPKVKTLQFTEAPAWMNGSALEAGPDVELFAEGSMVHAKFSHPRLMQRVGKHVVFSPTAYKYYVLEDEAPPKK